ncbi:hypothetical protein HYV57_02805 [Candidatus Peregrinibacteria bacterium]|nr:hypothetical protein [Candidatus Peregrinibacteria bacterium]
MDKPQEPYEILEEKIEKKYEQREMKNRKRMEVSGKSVFNLARAIDKHPGRKFLYLQKRKK